LCHPSPKVRSATHQLLVESSRVSKRRDPHLWVAELTSHVAWRPITVRKKMPHKTYGTPPKARSARPTITFDVQCDFERNTWPRSRVRSGTYRASTDAS